MHRDPIQFDPADQPLLERAAAWLDTADASQLAEDWPRQLAAGRGVDFATAALYQHVCRSNRLLNVDQPSDAPVSGLHVAVAPGAFYREYPETGAGGEEILSAARALGCRGSLIPTESVGTLAANARTIVEWLGKQPAEPVVLISLSKGGADVKCALADPQAAVAFKNVVAWVNVGGITDGSGMVSWLLERPLSTLIYRFLFWRRGRDFEFVRNLPRDRGALLDFTPAMPAWITPVHVVGFPLHRHFRGWTARTWHRRLSAWGPNDGASVLYDSCRLPGYVLPIWGADHFSKDRLDMGQTTADVLRWLAGRGVGHAPGEESGNRQESARDISESTPPYLLPQISCAARPLPCADRT